MHFQKCFLLYNDIMKSWTSPKAQVGKPSKISNEGFFATQDINKGEILSYYVGNPIDRHKLEQVMAEIEGSYLQVANSLYVAPLNYDEYKDSRLTYNHSCEPNAGMAGNVMTVAMRDIKAGEEITVDYAMIFSDDDFEMSCSCGNKSCRKLIKGSDWKLPNLQKKYDGYFSWYLQDELG